MGSFIPDAVSAFLTKWKTAEALNKKCMLLIKGYGELAHKQTKWQLYLAEPTKNTQRSHQAVVWVQVAVVSRLWHVRWRSSQHSPITWLADPIGWVPLFRGIVDPIWLKNKLHLNMRNLFLFWVHSKLLHFKWLITLSFQLWARPTWHLRNQ